MSSKARNFSKLLGPGVRNTISSEAISGEETSVSITSTAEVATIDLTSGLSFTHTLVENVTYSFTNAPRSGTSLVFTLKVTQDSTARTITWPASVDWAAATAPTLSAGSGEVDVFTFFTVDGGTNYYGFTSGQAMG